MSRTRQNGLSLFASVAPHEKLCSEYRTLRDSDAYAATRSELDASYSAFSDADGNFIEQFQTTAFSARVWELYLNQCFRSIGFTVQRNGASVDFVLDDRGVDFAVEAVTANASASIDPTAEPAILQENRHDLLAIRIGSALASKLAKRYWTRSGLESMPLLFAIEPFFDSKALEFSEQVALLSRHRSPRGTPRVVALASPPRQRQLH